MNSVYFRLAACSLLIHAGISHAQTAEDKTDIETLRQAIAAQQATLDAQQKQLQALEAAQLNTQDAPRWSVTYNRPTLTTADSRSSLSLRAVVQADYAHYSQDAAGPLSSDFRRGSVGSGSRENNAARDLSDGIYFRRARFGFEGVFNRDFSYRLMVELGGSGSEGAGRINDAWVSYTGFAPFSIQLGAFSPPANMDDGTTPDDALFIEKASPAELSRSLGGGDGRIGLGVRASGARWMSAVTLTSRTVADAEVFDAQSAVLARAAALAVTDTNYNLHLGASATYVLHAADAGVDATGTRYGIRFRNQPELRVDSTRLIDTGSIDASHAYAAGVELAGNWRNVFMQGENFWYGVERRNSTLANPKFSGFYLETSWVLTGESRRYNVATGSFQNPRPFIPVSGGWGAWELALRYSRSDLNSNAGSEGTAIPADGIRGGTQDIWTFGTNWYLNTNIKLVFNYMRIDVDRLNPSTTAFGAAPASPPVGVQIGQKLNAYALRMQYSL